MKKVKITVLKTMLNEDLAKECVIPSAKMKIDGRRESQLPPGGFDETGQSDNWTEMTHLQKAIIIR